MTEPTAPVPARGAAAGAAEPRPGGIRLGVVLVTIAVLVGTLAAAAVLLTTRFEPEGLAYIPAGTPVVVELRPDLPEAQRGALGTLLARVPGFSGSASAGDRVDAALDQLVRLASDGKRTYAGDLKPYAAGPIFLALPVIDGTGGAGDAPERMLAVLSPQGSAGCPGLETGAAVTVERYRDVDLRIRSGDSRAPACAAPGNLILLGDPASLRAALDAKAVGRDVTADATYQAAARTVPDGRAAWMYLDGHAAARMATAAAAARASMRPSPVASALVGLPSDAPEWIAASLQFVSEGAIVETVMPDPRPALLAAASGAPRATPAPDAVSAIAPGLPATTIAAIELHQAGPLLSAIGARGDAATPGLPGTGGATNLSQLGAVLSLVGGDAFLGSMDQAALVITRQGSSVDGGLVLRTADAAAAKTRLDQLRTLLALAAPGTGESEYHGARILTVPLAGLFSARTGGLPFGGTGTSGGSASALGLPAGLILEVAAHESHIVIGSGDGFVRSVIDTPAGSALADQSAYRTTIALAGSPNFAQAYLDLPDLLDLTESRTRADDRSTFERDLKPYLAPVAAVAMGATSSGGLARSRIVLYVP